MKKFSLKNLPEEIKVKVRKGNSGRYLIDLPDYDIFTEAETVKEIDFMINDLIYTYFNIPKKVPFKIYYLPLRTENKKIEGVKIPNLLGILTSNKINNYLNV